MVHTKRLARDQTADNYVTGRKHSVRQNSQGQTGSWPGRLETGRQTVFRRSARQLGVRMTGKQASSHHWDRQTGRQLGSQESIIQRISQKDSLVDLFVDKKAGRQKKQAGGPEAGMRTRGWHADQSLACRHRATGRRPDRHRCVDRKTSKMQRAGQADRQTSMQADWQASGQIDWQTSRQDGRLADVLQAVK